MRWLWIDRVVELEPGDRLVAVKAITAGEPHFADPGVTESEAPTPHVMPMSLIIEGMAQTAGILVGHTHEFREKVVLAKVSNASLSEDAPPGVVLRYTATLEQIDARGAATRGRVELIAPGGQTDEPVIPREIGRIDLMFSHLDNNLAGAEYPAHNFVFGDTFRAMLRASGLDSGVLGA